MLSQKAGAWSLFFVDLHPALPAELRSSSWFNQRLLYDIMIQCSWDIVRTFSQNDKQLQGTPGAIGVQHTHSRCLDYYPHVHLVMPAARLMHESGYGVLKQEKTSAKATRVICSIIEHWQKCFGPRCWMLFHKQDSPCLNTLPKSE